MKTRIALEGLHFHAFHGYYEEERKMGNSFILHVEVEIENFNSPDDDINDTVNYEDIYSICKDEMQNTQKLLESVVLNIVEKLKNSFPIILEGSVRLEKIGPQLGGKIDKAVISMTF